MAQSNTGIAFILIGIVFLGAVIWPAIVSSLYLLFRWGVIQGKIAFWFISLLAGYILMDGIPFVAKQLIKRYVGIQNINNALAQPNHKWFVEHYWSIMGAISIVLFLLPIISTHVIFRRFKRV